MKYVNYISHMEMALFKDGTFGGYAFVQISSVKGVQQVLKLDKKIMGRRYIQVMPITVQQKQLTINYLQRRNSTVQRLCRANQPTTTNVNIFVSRRGHVSSANRNINNNNNISSNISDNYNYYTGNVMTQRINFSNNMTVPSTYAYPLSQLHSV